MNSPRRSRNRVACRRCQRRKIRCDGNLPSCRSCLKAGVTCVNDGKQEVNRLYIANMENRMRWLDSLVQKNCPGVDVAHGPENDNRVLDEQEQMQGGVPNNHIDVDSGFAQNPCPQPDTQHDHESAVDDQARNSFQQGHEIGLVSLSSNGGPHYIGPSSGYFVARRILSDASHQRRRNTNETNAFASMNLSPLLNIPAPLPPQKDNVLELSARYFKTVHLIYPFLYEPSHMERIDRVYASERQLPLDIFHVFIVLAISALDLSRQFKVHLPVEGYYTAAMKHVDYVCGESSIDGLQSLLLLMVYALHNPSCGLNIWTLNYQCLASVIDLGLQRDIRASPAFQISVVEQEMRTRIFWVAYTFDRVICTMMGRPIGLRDEACELRFPRGTTDSELASTAGTNQTPSQPLPPSSLIYSIHLFKLARINSEIKYVTQSISHDTPAYAYPPVRDIYTWQQDVIRSVEDWFSTIPQQDDDGYDWVARVCKARYHEVMVLLLRPSPGIPSPSDHSLDLCFHHAVDLLRDFGVLYRSGYLLYSRLVVHSILLGTSVMLHCIWKVPAVAANCRLDELAVVLNTSQNILSSIGEYWDEANRAHDCVAELSSLTLQRLLKTPVAANAAASLTNRARSRFSYTQVASEVTSNPTHCQRQEHRDLVDKCSVTMSPYCQSAWSQTMGGSNMNIHSAYRQDEDTNPTSEFTNLFDNFLQDDYQGWDGMSNIDCLMWEVFR